MNQTYQWEGAGTTLPDGHRIFETHDGPDGAAWAIADDSGGTPDQTDDGVLWLDPTRCLGTTPLTIPVTDDGGGARKVVLTDTATLFFLSRLLRWTVEDEVRGLYYNVR